MFFVSSTNYATVGKFFKRVGVILGIEKNPVPIRGEAKTLEVLLMQESWRFATWEMWLGVFFSVFVFLRITSQKKIHLE